MGEVITSYNPGGGGGGGQQPNYSPLKRGHKHNSDHYHNHRQNVQNVRPLSLNGGGLIQGGNNATNGNNSNHNNQRMDITDPGTDGRWDGLDMRDMSLSRLSPKISQYSFLTGLYLSNNCFSIFPVAITQLKLLNILDMSGNRIQELPAEIGGLLALRVLLLSNNMLRTLPVEAGRLYHIETLGLNGNPLEETLSGIIQKDGANAIIKYLLETVTPVVQEKIERSWIQDTEGSSSSSGSGEKLTVLCYNVLCDRYCTSELYGYCPKWALEWNYRKGLILKEITRYNTDVICLQEVEMCEYINFFEPELKSKGYEGVFRAKSRARTMSEDNQLHVDGCAVFYRTKKFRLVKDYHLEFSRLAGDATSSRSDDTEDFINRVMTKDNIAVACVLESWETKQSYLVANAHIHWDPEFCDVKVIQAGLLMSELRKIQWKLNPKPAMIVCGDFNSLPQSGVVEFMANGVVPSDHEDLTNRHYGSFIAGGLRHPFKLRSAYSSVGELPFTNYTPDFKGVIDYIWYGTDQLSVTGCLGQVDQSLWSKVGYAPNPSLPSDHIFLATEFRRT